MLLTHFLPTKTTLLKTMVEQTTTPSLLFDSYRIQMKATLAKEMVGKKLNQLRTPSLVIDRSILKRNCQRLSKISTGLDNTRVRVHVKTHKVCW
jgi:diaminopimelate decarboxylase